MYADEALMIDAVARRLAAGTGMTFEGQRGVLLRSRLEECARGARAVNLGEFCSALLAEVTPGALWRPVIDAVVTDETSWFRYENQFRILRDFAIPIISSNKSFAGVRSLRVLSAGCSRGHEPYSIAIALAAMSPPAGGLEAEILGVDLSEAAIHYARRGHYSDIEMRGFPKEDRARLFSRTDSGWKLCEEVRGAVQFRRHNLLDPLPADAYDVIFCRNVTIYFERPTAERVLAMLAQSLAPGGCLFLGHTESLPPSNSDLRTVQMDGATVHRRVTSQRQSERVP